MSLRNASVSFQNFIKIGAHVDKDSLQSATIVVDTLWKVYLVFLPLVCNIFKT